MNVQQKGIIALIKSTLDKKPYTLPEGFSIGQAAREALRHKIVGFVYYGAVYCGIDKKLDPMQGLFRYLIPTMNVTEKQYYTVGKVCAAFDENGIDYMPVKGTVLQSYYPSRELRTMSDADILIRMEQYEKITTIMQQLGFAFEYESDHELVWKNKNLFLELHKRLIPSYNRDYAAYYGDGWRLGHPEKEGANRYVMSNEDQMIYLLTHLAKHYRDGGVGIRHMLDLYVFSNAHPDMDEAYMARELKKLRLLEFYNNVCDTLQVWFNDAPETEVTDLITNVIFRSGEFGIAEDRLAAGGLREISTGKSAKKMRKDRVWNALFQPYDAMCEHYPVLKKWKILLPVMWIVRAFKVVFFKTDRIKNERKKMKLLSDDRLNSYDRSLKAVGLSFEFKE